MITDEIRTKLEDRTAVLWCVHSAYGERGECCGWTSNTAVGSAPAIRGMWRNVTQLIEQRLQYCAQHGLAEWTPSTAAPELYVWLDKAAIDVDPGNWSLVAATGGAVGVHLIENRA